MQLFYSERDIFWVYDTFGVERLENDLKKGVFSSAQIVEACESTLGNEEEISLWQALLPYADLSRLPQWVERLNTPKFCELREHVLEHNPQACEFLGGTLKHNQAVWLLASDFSNPSQNLRDLFSSKNPVVDVLSNPEILDQTLKNLDNPKACGVFVWNGVKSLWASPRNLSIALQYAPKEFIEKNIVSLLRAARMANGADHPFGAYTAEEMVDALVPFVSQNTIVQWKTQNTLDTEASQNSDAVTKFGVPVSNGRYYDLIQMIEARTSQPPQVFDSSIAYTGGPAFMGEVYVSHPDSRTFMREQEIDHICSKLKKELFDLSPADVRNKINEYTADEVNAMVYVALQNAHPILAKVALDHIDWNNQFAQESLRLAMGATSTNTKQAMVQQMIVKKEISDLKGRLSESIAPNLDRDNDSPARRM